MPASIKFTAAFSECAKHTSSINQHRIPLNQTSAHVQYVHLSTARHLAQLVGAALAVAAAAPKNTNKHNISILYYGFNFCTFCRRDILVQELDANVACSRRYQCYASCRRIPFPLNRTLHMQQRQRATLREKMYVKVPTEMFSFIYFFPLSCFCIYIICRQNRVEFIHVEKEQQQQ